MNNVKQFKKYCHGMSVTPPPPSRNCCQKIIYLVCGALKINNY